MIATILFTSFYRQFVLCGVFEPGRTLNIIKKEIKNNEEQGEIKRIYPEEKKQIAKEKIEVEMEVSNPLFVIGWKDMVAKPEELVKKHIAIEILLNLVIGKSSQLYQKLYEQGLLVSRARTIL